jgi:hypothetical protein
LKLPRRLVFHIQPVKIVEKSFDSIKKFIFLRSICFFTNHFKFKNMATKKKAAKKKVAKKKPAKKAKKR